jgi:hypothetical protein
VVRKVHVRVRGKENHFVRVVVYHDQLLGLLLERS